jgi:hypothetical protein
MGEHDLVRCTACNGSGVCGSCRGTSRDEIDGDPELTCPDCAGTNACPACGGTGRVPRGV